MRRIIIVSLFAGSSAASAAPLGGADCEAVRNASIPLQVTYHSRDGTSTILQSLRDSVGDRVVLKQETLSNSQHTRVIVTKARFHDGLPVSAELWTTYAGKHSYRTATYDANGLPRDFDHRTSITYEMRSVTKDSENVTESHASRISYSFKSEEDLRIGPCSFRIVHGEIEATDNLGRSRHTFQIYIPDLSISMIAGDAEPVADGFSTVFSEIEPPTGGTKAQ